jgi:predicted dehydrogenase
MNELDVYLAEGSPSLRGWRTVNVTEPDVHPWASQWWGAGHVLGYEATFVHELAEILCQFGTAAQSSACPPTFQDGLRCQRVLAALAVAAREQRWVEVSA